MGDGSKVQNGFYFYTNAFNKPDPNGNLSSYLLIDALRKNFNFNPSLQSRNSIYNKDMPQLRWV